MIGKRVTFVDLHIVIVFLLVLRRAGLKLLSNTIQGHWSWSMIQRMLKFCQTEQPVITSLSSWTFVSRWESDYADQWSCVQDCNASISLDPHFVKPKLRRALALQTQKKWQDTLRGYMYVLKIEPSCNEATEGLRLCASSVEIKQSSDCWMNIGVTEPDLRNVNKITREHFFFH